MRSLESRIKTIQNRAAEDLREAKKQAELELERSLDEQKREIEAEAKRHETAALQRLEVNLTASLTKKMEVKSLVQHSSLTKYMLTNASG